ncbi:phosphatase PAP2 family protein [Streptomyces sp. NPDC058045]|uniref:phosphatase PAP2 family protein n=1 Tax=Streptomyces sp. NPDC058045 TaxID=3346311 RepID=UPI0036EDC759
MPQTDAPADGAIGSRLRWWTELPLILLVYGAYSGGRLLARGDVDSAVDHGLSLLRIEQALHIDAEHPLNRIFTAHPSLGVPADFWYASLHYLVTPAVLIWLFRRRPGVYRAARTWLMAATLIGLIGFTLLPTCPPRLLDPGYGFTDTMAQFSSYGWWGGEASAPRGLGGMTNQYAAMPSLHVGWALWCGVMLWRQSGNPLLRTAAVVYPLVTTIVVMGTANHYLLDAVAGAAVMGAGLLLARPVMRAADRVRNRLTARLAPVPPVPAEEVPEEVPAEVPAEVVEGVKVPAGAQSSPIVGDGCQTSPGERFPRQREEQRPQPSADPAAGDGAPAAAR